ncbi:MAG: chorismate mutase [Leptolyngbyaceae bacterium]|nr:chorismate mutase [Leptolyngbyaceae bacterium]
MERIVRAIRGATTASANTKEAIEEAVVELLDVLEAKNPLNPGHIISVTFSVTADLDAVFPAAIARQRPSLQGVPLLDVQHMAVKGSLPQCIRLLMNINALDSDPPVHHIYLRQARELRPDLDH